MSESKPTRAPGSQSSLDEEIAAALGDASLMDMIGEEGAGEDESGHRIGTVVDVGESDVLVEFNAREQGTCPITEFARRPVQGEKHPFHIGGRDRKTSLWVLSLGRHASAHAEWIDLEIGRIVRVQVIGFNKGGLEVRVSGKKAFIPYSQVALERVEDGAEFVGKALDCEVTDIDRSRDRIVLSRRTVLARLRDEAREQVMAGLTVGDVRKGKVTRLESYGAFVDVGGIEGLLHVSNIDYQRIEDPSKVLALGQEVEVKVIKIEGDKVGLGMKQLKPDPWDEWTATHTVGTMTGGKVTRIMDFGAFVEVAPGVEGLLHIGQLAPQRVTRVRAVVQEGQEVSVRIASIEPERRRIGLSLLTARGNKLGDESEVDDDTIKRYTTEPKTPAGSSVGSLLKQAMEARGKKGQA